MKLYLSVLIVLSIFLIAACGGQAEVTPDTTPIPETASEPTPEPEPPVEQQQEQVAPAEQGPKYTDVDQKTIDRWTTSCENGAANLCSALKKRYGIDASPTSKSSKAYNSGTTKDSMEETGSVDGESMDAEADGETS